MEINTYCPMKSVVIITENEAGNIYVISTESFEGLWKDWNDECIYCPSNNSRVFCAFYNGEPINPYCYQDFETFMVFMRAFTTSGKRGEDTK